MSGWQPIETAPMDGTWFMTCRACDGFYSYEIGRYEPILFPRYVPVDGGLFRREEETIVDWRGFSNMHRATHWMPLPEPPSRAT
jgi:Protein of unknown function (DUF551)